MFDFCMPSFRPINLDELFPEREQMNIPEVGILRKAANPIIIITKETNSESEEDDEVATAPVEAVQETKAEPAAVEKVENAKLEDNKVKAKEIKQEAKTVEEKPEVKTNKDTTKNNIELLEKLVSLHGGWFDDDIRKKIKPIPKGWQLIPV